MSGLYSLRGFKDILKDNKRMNETGIAHSFEVGGSIPFRCLIFFLKNNCYL